MWPQVLVYKDFTLLAYAPEQICLLYCTYVLLHCQSSLNIDPTLLHISVKINNIKQFTMLLPYMCPQQICPLNVTCVPWMTHVKCPNYLMCINEWSMPIYIPHINCSNQWCNHNFCTQMMTMMMMIVMMLMCNADDATVQLHIPRWPLYQISQKTLGFSH